MFVHVKLLGLLKNRLPIELRDKQPTKLEVKQDSTVETLLKQLGIPDNLIVMVLVNGAYSNKSRRLDHGNLIVIYLPVAGG